ncbi:MAG: hypothetical protein EPO08_20740 [Rhodospirillaceae bacterium]|nr:MAG: hypothetical protein EPO08_20740 [Rhodospirillaceae bacterium]
MSRRTRSFEERAAAMRETLSGRRTPATASKPSRLLVIPLDQLRRTWGREAFELELAEISRKLYKPPARPS